MSRSSKERPVETPARLPAERTQALRFGKMRSVQSSALLEDYANSSRTCWPRQARPRGWNTTVSDSTLKAFAQFLQARA
jgi:hypothetical protein